MTFGSSLFVMGLLSTWITPLWLMGVGAAAGLIVLAVAYGILRLCSPRLADIALTSVLEGILLPIGYVALFLAAFSVLAVLLVPRLPYRAVAQSVSRLGSVGTQMHTFEIPPESLAYALPDIDVRLVEMRGFAIQADQSIKLDTNISPHIGQMLSMKLSPNAPSSWQRPFSREESQIAPDDKVQWTVQNVNDKPVKLQLETFTDIQYPEVWVVPATAIALVSMVLLYLLVRAALPKISAIALTTTKESMAQPLFYVVLALGSFLLIAFVFIPYNTFGEDVKMLKSSGLTLIMVLAIIVAVWSASVSVSEEVEGRTALTLLSKPVKRRQFVLGKFLGILGPVIVLFIVLGLLFMGTISYKVVYDSREVAKSEPTWQLCFAELIQTLPGLILAFFEAVVLSAISVAISTRLSMLANLIVCASVYVLGNLVPLVVHSSVGRFEIVRFAGQFIATILPVLDHFNIQAAVAAGAGVPLGYLGMAFVYCVLYSSIAMLLGLAMFEDRDLA